MSAYHYRLAGALRVGDKYLLVRSLNVDSSEKSGFHLPGKPLVETNHKGSLRRFFSNYYDSDVSVLGCLQPIKKKGDWLVVHLIEENTPMRFPSDRFEYGFFSLSQLENLNIEAADKVAIEKVDCFLPLLKGKVRTTVLTPMEIDKINHMLDSLRYFSSAIPSEERKQFLALVNSEISYAGILRAYRFLLKQYDANYFEYAEKVEKKKSSRL